MTELGIGALSGLAVGSCGQSGVVTIYTGVSLLHCLVVGADGGELESGQAETLDRQARSPLPCWLCQ